MSCVKKHIAWGPNPVSQHASSPASHKSLAGRLQFISNVSKSCMAKVLQFLNSFFVEMVIQRFPDQVTELVQYLTKHLQAVSEQFVFSLHVTLNIREIQIVMNYMQDSQHINTTVICDPPCSLTNRTLRFPNLGSLHAKPTPTFPPSQGPIHEAQFCV